MGTEFLFMTYNARPHRGNIVNTYLQSEDITCMEWPEPVLDAIEHLWDMLGQRIAAPQLLPTYAPELRRELLA